MPLRLKDQWVWDFWHVWDREDCHLFYLQAPKSLGDEALRHHHATIGHAVSQDLERWTQLPDAIAPGPSGAWDDVATWTGCVVRDGGAWHMFYTGVSSRDGGLVQRVGRASSSDLITWHKDGANPLLEADAQWYERYDGTWFDEAWRDPWVFRHDGSWHALVTARVNTGHVQRRGVLGHAVSSDLASWEVCPPATAPGRYPQMEVPQIIDADGTFLAVYSAARIDEDRESGAPSGTLVAAGLSPLGPFDVWDDEPLWMDAPGKLYSGKLIERPGGVWVALAFENRSDDGTFVGAITDPMPIDLSTFPPRFVA